MLKEADIDPITRELTDFALDRRIWTMGWFFEQPLEGLIFAKGYVSVSLLHMADEIRRQWVDAVGLISDQAGGYIGEYEGKSGLFKIHLPDAIGPDELCHFCSTPFDPRDLRPGGHKRYGHSQVCRSCITRHAPTAPPDGGPVMHETS